MHRFSVFIKRSFLFAIIFMFLTGNICFSEEITLTTVMPASSRILRGTINSATPGTPGNGFTVARLSKGKYEITFVPAFPVGSTPTVTCIYGPSPNTATGLKSQVVSVDNTTAIVSTVKLDDGNKPGGSKDYSDTGSIIFIAIGRQ